MVPTCSAVEVWDDEQNCGNIELMQEVAGRRMEVEWLSRYIYIPGAQYERRGNGRWRRQIYSYGHEEDGRLSM